MVRSPARAITEPAFEVRVTKSVPLPAPDPGATEAQGTALEAAQVQFGPLVWMATLPTPEDGPNGLPRADVFRVTLQGNPS